MKITSNLRVRTYECDSYNHVNNAVYLNYLEYGRMDYLNKIGFRYKDFVDAGYFVYVTHVDIHYKSSAFFNDDLFIETYPTELGVVKGNIHQKIYKYVNEKEVVCAEADVTWACVTKEGRPSKLPEGFAVEGLSPKSN